MASAAFSLAPFFQEKATCRASKDVSTTFPGYGNRQDILQSTSLLVSSPAKEKWLSMNPLSTYNLPQSYIPLVEKPVLLDTQGACPDAVAFSFGIAEQHARREMFLKFLFNHSYEDNVIDSYFLNDLMRLKPVAIESFDMLPLYEVGEGDAEHILNSSRKFLLPISVLKFIEDSSLHSNMTVHPDGQMLLTGAESEIKDLMSCATEFNKLKSFTTSNKQTLVVPYFTRSRGGHARTNSQGSASSEQIVAPSKSSEDMKLKPSSKKKLKPASRERDREHYQKNYFRACENLLSVTVDKKRTAATVILSLKKSGPEITQLLSQCAAGIAGTGLAILLSVAFKSGNGRAPVPLTTTKLFNAGLGIGFFYLSWSVNRLRDAVAAVRRSTKKLKLTEEEMVTMVNGSITAVLYRAAALAAVALLRFA